jgi:hypothetical protein
VRIEMIHIKRLLVGTAVAGLIYVGNGISLKALAGICILALLYFIGHGALMFVKVLWSE